MPKDIQQKATEQLVLLSSEIETLYGLLKSAAATSKNKEELIQLVHKLTGLCLTFKLNEAASISRFAEHSLKRDFSDLDNEVKEGTLDVLSSLIEKCLEIKSNPMPFLDVSVSAEEGAEQPEVKILVVDDDPVITMLAERKLKNRGFNVITAEDGKLGVETAMEQLPHIILMDGSMPNMDGIEAAKILKNQKITAHIPIFLLTAHEVDKLQKDTEYDIIDECLEKPFNVEKVVTLVTKYLV